MNKGTIYTILSKKLSVSSNGNTHIADIYDVAVRSKWGEIRTSVGQFELSDMQITQLASGETVRMSFMGLKQVFKLI